MDPGPAYKRRRPAVACTECRRRKIRCDRVSPCGPCSKSSLGLRCVYSNSSTSLDRMHQEPFSQLDFSQSVLKPMFPEVVDDLDMFSVGMTYLHDESDAGFIDYFALGVPNTGNEPTELPASHLDGGSLVWTDRTSRNSVGASCFITTPQLFWGSGSGLSGPASSNLASLSSRGLGSSSTSGSPESGSSGSIPAPEPQTSEDINANGR